MIDEAWMALKEECCVNPETAVRCVMVNEEQFRKAMRVAIARIDAKIMAPLPPLEDME
jgi:hypothetical protein